jgi:ATP-binding cassette subfamily C protein CydCD
VAALRTMARGPLYLLGLLGTLKALGLIMVADAVATGIVVVASSETSGLGTQDRLRWVVLLGVAGAMLRAGIAWATQVVSHRAVIGEKQRIRARLAARFVQDPTTGRNVGAMTTLATAGLDELDKYYTVFLPALVATATVPLLVGARILFADPLSALVIVLTVPLIPVFMALIGMHTNDRVQAAADAMARLSDHLVELARGLPVLIGLGRVREQTDALRRISDDHRKASIRTLRTAFLSSLALELVATLSVAVVAVLVGVRLVSGTMPLEVGLLALVLAPECFAPLRAVGSAFHASQDGVEAQRRVLDVLDAAAPTSTISMRRGSRVRVDGLSVRYAGRTEPAVTQLSFDTQPRGITLLHGASGAGKSTVLAALARVLPTDATVRGGIVVPDHDRVGYLPQHPHAVGSSVLDELAVYAPSSTETEHTRLLEDLGLSELAGTDPALLSPGELRRLAFARVVARVRAGAQLVLLDEPTAHLDASSAAVVRRMIVELSASATVVVASHDPAIHAIADRWVQLDASRAGKDELLETSGRVTATSIRRPIEQRHVSEQPFRELVAVLRPVLPRIAAAVLLGTLATAFAIALTGVSGWLIVQASEHPPILYLLVAIVGVRFFGIGRGVLRWCERLLTHDAILAGVTTLRIRLWQGLAALGPANRSLLGAGSTLDRLISDADRVRDLTPRVVMPPLVGVTTTVVAIGALCWIYPPSLLLTLPLAAVALVAAPLVAVLTDRTASATATRVRSASVRAFASMLSAGAELKANGSGSVMRERVAALDAQRAQADRRGAWSLGVGTALVVLACSSSAILMLSVSAGAVASGSLSAGLLAVLVLTPLGLIDSLLDCVDAAQQWPALRRVLGRVGEVTGEAKDDGTDAGTAGTLATVPPVLSLATENLAYRYPQSAVPAFAGATASVRRGEWLAVTGPSGSGKSTLLAVLLRYLAPTDGRYLLNGSDATAFTADAVRRRVAWCPQEGHLFDSSLRANLLIARGRDEAPSDAELTSVLRQVGLGDFLAGLPDGLDTRIGSGGSFMSGGQRQRVAVARTLLARSDVLLIDEPTAHLDDEAATMLLADVRTATADKITVLVTHQATGISPDDRHLSLGAAQPNSRVALVLDA